MSTFDKNLLNELIQRELDGVLVDAEFKQLQSILMQNDDAVEYYSKSVVLFSLFQGSDSAEMFSKTLFDSIEDDLYSSDILKALAEDEQLAEAVKSKKSEIEFIVQDKRNIKYEKFDKLSKIYNVIVTLAAVFMLFFIAYANIFPPQLTEPVAIVQDQIDIVWNRSSAELNNNDKVLTNQLPYQIERGILEIQYDKGVNVVIEGPAKFQFERAGVYLEYGLLFSKVSESGSGFRVDTPTCQFIDLGTEFGIKADVDGSSEMHVVKGKVQMYTGGGAGSKTISEYSASRYNAKIGKVCDVNFNSEIFVRQIESKSNMVWRGEMSVDLADIVGGGNGFGTGQLERGVDPGTGQSIVLRPEHIYDIQNASNEYRLFQANPFIDGVFVPNAADGKQVVTSFGHVFSECSQTNGKYFGKIINGPAKPINGGEPGLVLEGIYYGTPQNPAIFMHTNQGVTFDLDSIRKTVHSTEIVRFKSLCGISEVAPDYGLADITVLVDGQVRFNQKNITKAQSFRIDITLTPQDRFLTLLTTISVGKQRPEEGRLNLEHGDWCLFGNPVLELE